MSREELSPVEKELRFNKWLISQYLKYGSVDEVFKANYYDIPISYPSYHRLLNKWGIVKAAGPNNTLSEAVEFLAQLAQDKIPLERLYKKTPPSFQTSMATMHRIMHCVKEGVTRRVGTALVLTSDENPNNILVGTDISTPRLELGKPYGSVSLPMGFSRKRNSQNVNILRVLQQEVFTFDAVERKFPFEILNQEIKPFMFLDIVDVRVSVYHLTLPKSLVETACFSSYKLKDHRYVHLSDLTNDREQNLRSGIKEIALGYKQNREMVGSGDFLPLEARSDLNKALITVPVDCQY